MKGFEDSPALFLKKQSQIVSKNEDYGQNN